MKEHEYQGRVVLFGEHWGFRPIQDAVLGTGIEIDMTDEYDYPASLPSFYDLLHHLADRFGTQSMTWDDVELSGCETCGHGGEHGHVIRVFVITKNEPLTHEQEAVRLVTRIAALHRGVFYRVECVRDPQWQGVIQREGQYWATPLFQLPHPQPQTDEDWETVVQTLSREMHGQLHVISVPSLIEITIADSMKKRGLS
jgi:hypothetical protein